MNYERDIQIDETALDVEWLEQPNLMLKYARHEAECEREMDKVKEKLDLTKAQIDAEVRKTPSDYGIEKITETVIQNTIIQEEQYQDAYNDYLEAKYNYNIAKNAVRALAQRKDALENLVRLHGQQYFAGPNTPRDISHERLRKQRNSQTDSKISTKLKRAR